MDVADPVGKGAQVESLEGCGVNALTACRVAMLHPVAIHFQHSGKTTSRQQGWLWPYKYCHNMWNTYKPTHIILPEFLLSW